MATFLTTTKVLVPYAHGASNYSAEGVQKINDIEKEHLRLNVKARDWRTNRHRIYVQTDKVKCRSGEHRSKKSSSYTFWKYIAISAQFSQL